MSFRSRAVAHPRDNSPVPESRGLQLDHGNWLINAGVDLLKFSNALSFRQRLRLRLSLRFALKWRLHAEECVLQRREHVLCLRMQGNS